jgi:hypothetical protein
VRSDADVFANLGVFGSIDEVSTVEPESSMCIPLGFLDFCAEETDVATPTLEFDPCLICMPPFNEVDSARVEEDD